MKVGIAAFIAGLGCPERGDPDLWRQALTHSSAEGRSHYERLEFLGDAVLKLVVSQWLYQEHTSLDEGEMTKVRARAVSDATLARVALEMGLADQIIYGPAEKKSPSRGKVGILASSFEAVLGVVFLTGGTAAADAFLARWLGPELDISLRLGGRENYKAVLQELTQGRWKCLPEYRLLRETGPEHEREYEIGVWVAGEPRGEGRGKSKKSAEQQAAQAALEAIREGQSP